MSQKLWVEHRTPSRNYGPTEIPIDGCSDVDDFIKVGIKNEPLLAIPKDCAFNLFHSDGTTEIHASDSLTFLVAGNSGTNPIIVKTTFAVPSAIMQLQPIPLGPECQIPFYNKICDALEQGPWITWDLGKKKAILSSPLNRLFVRDCYQSIASSIKPGVNKTIIKGTPGIGKSLFLIYLLFKLVKEGKRVFFIYLPNAIYFDGKGGVFELRSIPSTVNHDFWSDDLWC